MIGTEEQARKGWWCPMARGGDTFGANRDHHDDPICLCLGSACAAWRWKDPAPSDLARLTYWPVTEDDVALRSETEPSREGATEGGEPAVVPDTGVEWVPMTGHGDECDGGFWEETLSGVQARHAANLAKRRGYCGLAGSVTQ